MKYCKRCLQPDTRPNIVFSADGVCPACTYFEELAKVDWRERIETLQEIIGGCERKKGQYFDCIIGVSGGKDSTRQALWVRDKLKLNPLLVCLSYPPEQITTRGADNISNLIELGFDVVISAPAPETWRRLMRASFLKFANWCRSTELSLFSSVPQLAIAYEIPLILWGENPGLQIGDMSTIGRNGYDGNNLRYGNTLNGAANAWMQEVGFSPQQLIPYRYPDAKEFDAAKLQIIYLGWFLKDWSMVNNGAYSCAFGLEPRHEPADQTGDVFGVSALDEDWVTVNQMVKYYKFGFGKATEYVNEEIRLGRMTRKDGIDFVAEYDGRCSDELVDSFCSYISITSVEFWDVVRQATSNKLFVLGNEGVPLRKFEIGVGI